MILFLRSPSTVNSGGKNGASRLVLREADRNLRRKAPPVALKAFRRFLQQVKVRVVLTPSDETMRAYEGMVDPKDLPVLAAAVESKVDFFLTLDRRHFLSSGLEERIKKPHILGPADFLRNIYLKGKI